jgi:serine/threonine protein kinase
MKLEVLPITLKDAVMASKNSFRKEPNAASTLLRNILAKIFELLDHFYTKYHFRHCDLHANNIMTDPRSNIVENLKIIDFGLAYVNIDMQKIGVPGEDFNDCYNITFYLQYLTRDIITKSLNDLLEKFTDYPDTTPPSTYLEELSSAKITNNAKGGKRKTRKTISGKPNCLLFTRY